MHKKIIEEGENLLDRRNIGKALDFIAHEASVAGFISISEKAERILNDLNYMLNYFATGAQDPTRQDMLAHIYDNAYNLLSVLGKNLNKEIYEPIRIAEVDVADTQMLFSAIENNFPSTHEDKITIQQIIMNEDNPLYLRAMTLSALTLNLLKYFDNEKFESLYTYTLEDQPVQIRQRAWVAIVLITMAHDRRITTQPRLVEQLRFLCEEGIDINGENILMTIQLALYQCLEAMTARKILKEELTPDLEKGIDELKKIKESNKDITDEEDITPLWNEYVESSGIQDKLNDFISLQKNGVDIMFDAFVHMSHLPFFRNKCNWFAPFDFNHPDIQKMIEHSPSKENYIRILGKAGNMCATDKYSNIFMLAFMPDTQMQQVEEALTQNEIKLNNIVEASPEEEIINYLHDLFRYYNIYNGSKTDYNPFDRNLYFGKYYGLEAVVDNIDSKKTIASFLFKNKKYKDAQNIFADISKQEITEEILQKYAYCIMQKDMDDLVLCDILALCNNYFPNNKWTIKNYAKSLMIQTNYHAAEIVLRDGIKRFPDDVSLTVSLAKCLMKMERYEDASKLLYKADLMKENSAKITRNLAYCLLLLGNKDNAEKYISKTLSMQNVKSIDWINGGHIALLNGNIQMAIERYSRADEEDLFLLMTDNDRLIKLGIPQDIITLTFELLNRKQKEQ